MSRRVHAITLCLLVWALLPAVPRGQAGAPSQDSRTTISGSVVDQTFTPIAGVALTLDRAGHVDARTTSDADGKFKFTGVAPGDYRVRAELAGFAAFSRDLRIPVGATMMPLPVVLTRATDAATSKAADARGNPAAPGSMAGGAGGRGGAPAPVDAPRTDAQSGERSFGAITALPPGPTGSGRIGAGGGRNTMIDGISQIYEPSGESYAHVDAGRFQRTSDQPLSTFGADVDTASYSNVRRFLSSGQLPPPDAVRIEELVNYFRFGYTEPRGNVPLALTTEVGDCPWVPSHKLVLIGARAKASAAREIAGRNLVLLIDVSGSMQPADRLPLIKTALGLFVDTLPPDDRLAIVTYAGSSGVALPSTPVRRRDVIQQAIARLSAGGSTNGGQGLITAYDVATQAFIPGGVNRVILATDGDFNVGIVNHNDLLRLIQHEKDSGVFLSVFGVGTGNLKDSTMEMLADKGNGHYAYLDSLQEARRVLLREADATLETVAKDVKFQVEFNPSMVTAWKLIGYENRALAAPDFNNDRKDGGEMGAGHTVTVLYEVVPAGAGPDEDRPQVRPVVDPLKYQTPPQVFAPGRSSSVSTGEWLTVKARYKLPESEESRLITQPVRSGGRVVHLPFAAAVADFGLLLRTGSHDPARWDALTRRLANITVPGALIADKDGFSELVGTARGLMRLR